MEALGREPPGNLDTCVISAPATCDSSKALNTSLLGRRYLSMHHQFHNPLTWSKRQLFSRLLTPAAYLRVPDKRDSGRSFYKTHWTQCNYHSLHQF